MDSWKLVICRSVSLSRLTSFTHCARSWGWGRGEPGPPLYPIPYLVGHRGSAPTRGWQEAQKGYESLGITHWSHRWIVMDERRGCPWV